MAAKDILRRNKTSIVTTLCADYKIILNKAYENKLITQREYNNLKSINKENDEGHVVELVDKIMNKGEETCQLFLALLQTDDIQETFPELKNVLEKGNRLSPHPVQASSVDNTDHQPQRGEEPSSRRGTKRAMGFEHHPSPQKEVRASSPPPPNAENVMREPFNFPKATKVPKKKEKDEPYELKSQPTGLCLIINNKTFPGDGKEIPENVRQGTDKDAGRLGEVFSRLGFRVLMCTDQTKDQMEQVLECFASQRGLSQLQQFKVQEWTRSGFTDLREAPRHGDAFICCLLSHGSKGVVLGVDRKPLPIEEITRIFRATDQSPLTGKPKVFLIQACQGGLVHPRVESDDLQADDSPSTFIPQGADFFFQYATVQDYYSMRDPTKGSWFIQSVCEQLEEGCDGKEEIEDILRCVNKEVAGKEGVLKGGPTKQMPEIRHTLRKPLVLTPHRN